MSVQIIDIVMVATIILLIGSFGINIYYANQTMKSAQRMIEMLAARSYGEYVTHRRKLEPKGKNSVKSESDSYGDALQPLGLEDGSIPR